MRELRDWMERLESIEAPEDFSLRLKRLSSPSPLAFEDSIVRVALTPNETEPFGSLRGRLSVLVWPDLASTGFQQDEAVAAELGALLTFATRRRVHVAAGDVCLTMEGTERRTFLPRQILADRSLTGPLPDDTRERLEIALAQIAGLDDADADALGPAIRLHYASVLLYDLDLDAAYALAVGGLEVLSRTYGAPPDDWSSWEEAARFDAAFDEVGLTAEQAERVREELLKGKQLRLRRTFADYCSRRLPDEFWEGLIEDFTPSLEMDKAGSATFRGVQPADAIPMETVVPRDRETLRRRLLASYDARSLYVHVGGSGRDEFAVLHERIGRGAPRAEPLQFLAVRTILETLISTELQVRSTPAALPEIRMTNRPHPDVPDSPT